MSLRAKLLASAWVRAKPRGFLAKKATLADRRDARVRTADRRHWHYLGAVENFLFCNAGAALLGAALFSRARIMESISVAAGLTGLFGLACLGAGAYFGLGVGGMERVTAYPFPLWIAGMGAWLSKAAPPPAPSP